MSQTYTRSVHACQTKVKYKKGFLAEAEKAYLGVSDKSTAARNECERIYGLLDAANKILKKRMIRMRPLKEHIMI
jgi:hypothetical protein